jgi:hypothetical protein
MRLGARLPVRSPVAACAAALVSLLASQAGWRLQQPTRTGEPHLSTQISGAEKGTAVTVVTHLHRFAVKGLGRDSLQNVVLTPGSTMPYDRQWAIKFRDSEPAFDPVDPRWIHKSAFLCAFTAGSLLGGFATSFDDATRKLRVASRADGERLLEARVDSFEGRTTLGNFFSNASGRAVDLVTSAAAPHQFGNTGSGVAASGDTRTLHIVNANTVRALALATGLNIDPGRFRANLILDGALPAWAEFDWVGSTISIGGTLLRVIKRTVRCEGVSSDPWTSSAPVIDVPAALQRHFPQHGPFLGVYAQVVTGGVVKVGDAVLAP